MKSLLNAFTKKEGKDELSGARGMGISGLVLGERGLRALPGPHPVPSHYRGE